MYEGLKIANMYTLSETIAAELLSSVTYPWEALPKIGDFIKKLGPTLPEEDYEYRGEDVWVAKDATVFPSAYIHRTRRSSARVQKSDTVHLSVVMRLWVKVQLSVIQLSLKMSYFSTKFRYRIIIMWEIPFLDLRHIWEPVLLLPMLSQIRSWWLFIPVKAILRLVSRNSVQCWETV